MRGRIARELGGRGQPAADALHARSELRVGLDVCGGRPVSLAGGREDQVVALAPHRHRRAADRVLRPGEPGNEQYGGGDRRRARAQEPLAHGAAPKQRREDDKRRDQHEDRANERDGSGERAGAGPGREPPALPRACEDIDAGERDRPRERLREHERDVVLRPRVDRVEEAGQERDPIAPPPADGDHQQPRAETEEHRLPDERRRVVSADDGSLAERREVERVPRRPEDLPFQRLPDALVDGRAGDVEPVREDVDEAGLERRRVRAVEERVRAGDVRPAVRLLVHAYQRDVQKAVQAGHHREEERHAPEGHGRGL